LVGTFDDTIIALATPRGRSALAVVRMSGREAHQIARSVLRRWPAAPRHPTLTHVFDPATGDAIDQVLATIFEASSSYTGEPMVEFSGHGGHVAPARLLSVLMSCGAREALPGEFTRRALLNGKLDLLRAEAIADLIDATSDTARRAAVQQLDGSLSRIISDLRTRLLDLEALLVYDIDFPEEDDGPIALERVIDAAQGVEKGIESLLDTTAAGEIVRAGAVTVLAGPPNVGKSSLFNALVGHQRAIVTDIPGTTRDAIEAVIESDGWPIRLVDTAGLRESEDVVERIGVDVAHSYLERAHLVLACASEPDELTDILAAVRGRTPAPTIAVVTKIDRVSAPRAKLEIPGASGVIPVSAQTREGLGQLVRQCSEVLAAYYEQPHADVPLITRERHAVALRSSLAEIRAFRASWETRALPAAVAAVHVRSAIHELEELVGSVDVEEVLDRVFASFCVGK
jgi:tRNA modification GTPase